MKKIIFLFGLMLISTILFADVFTFTVNDPHPDNPDLDFETIQSAINILSDFINGNDIVNIIVHPKPIVSFYEENISIGFEGNRPDLNLLSCDYERVLLKPAGTGTTILKILRYGMVLYDKVTIHGFDFKNNNPSDVVEENPNGYTNCGIYTSAPNVIIDDCRFIPMERKESFLHDIYLYQDAGKATRILTVQNCKFEQVLSWNRFLKYARIIGILSDPEHPVYSYTFIANNNKFINNKKSIDTQQAGNITMEGNSYDTSSIGEFHDRRVSFNLTVHRDVGREVNVMNNYINNANNAFCIVPLTGITFNDNYVLNTVESNITFTDGTCSSNNVITFDEIITYDHAEFVFTPHTLKNNTIYRNPTSGYVTLSLYIENLFNNIIWGFDESNINGTGAFNKIANLFDPDLNYQETNLNINGFPSFVGIEDNDFSLAWPCKAIGNGYSYEFDDLTSQGYDINLITYQDATIDIGAIPFDQDRKQYHHFEGGTTTQNWTGFPALDPDNESTIFYDGINQTLPNNNMIVMFKDLADYLGNYATVNYQDWDGAGNYIGFNFVWGNDETQSTLVQPYLGYKITTQTDIDHWFGGLLQDPDMDIPLPETSNQIWLGYHRTEAVAWYIAFADILDNIEVIKHKDWNFVWTGTEWLGESYDNSYECVLKTGDFVSISLRTNTHAPATFNWNVLPLGEKIPIVYRNAQRVSFVEEDDYTPIFVELGDNSSIKEVAVYVGDICKGGVQTDGKSRVMIKAFLNDVPENAELSIVTFDASKNQRKENQLIQYSQNLGVWDNIKSLNASNRNYYHIGIGKNNDVLLETTSIVTHNYPNPFNPETTIEFNNPKAGLVNLNIYNLRGQLVKNLMNKDIPQGINKVIWNGTDNNNKQTASGIYFYKITSNNKSVTKKIIMMK